MADLLSDGNIRVDWVPSIASIAAPTVAELNAGTRLDTHMTPDGLKIEPDTSEVDNSKLSSTYGTNQAGRRSFKGSITYIATSPRVLESVLVYVATGYLVVRREVSSSTAWTAAQKAEVYPAQLGEPSRMYGPNAMQMRDVPLFYTSDPNTDATVAA